MKLSILMPVYNEKENIEKIIPRVLAVKIPMQKELIVVDDCSTDGTREKLKKLASRHRFKLFLHNENKGKGGAVKTALKHSTGDVVIFQDADLEYFPEDYPELVRPFLEGKADMVLGSRFNEQNKWKKETFYKYLHYIGNRLQGLVMSFLYMKWMPDVWVCYKCFNTRLIKSVEVKGNRFDYEIELVTKVLKKNPRLVNVPIRYVPRGFDEGKKITWRDGYKALYTTLMYRFFGR